MSDIRVLYKRSAIIRLAVFCFGQRGIGTSTNFCQRTETLAQENIPKNGCTI